MADIERALDLLEEVRNFLNETPLPENAPIHQIAEAIDEVWRLTQGFACREPATEGQIESILNCTDTTTGEGRSPWQVFFMPNGDKVFGTYPQGELYLSYFT